MLTELRSCIMMHTSFEYGEACKWIPILFLTQHVIYQKWVVFPGNAFYDGYNHFNNTVTVYSLRPKLMFTLPYCIVTEIKTYLGSGKTYRIVAPLLKYICSVEVSLWVVEKQLRRTCEVAYIANARDQFEFYEYWMGVSCLDQIVLLQPWWQINNTQLYIEI